MMNFSNFFFATSNANTNAHRRVKQLVPLKNNIMIPVTRPIIKNTGYKPIETSKSKLFHDQMIEICRKNNIQPTYDNNLIGSATGIGDILLKFASIKFKTTDCTRFNFNLEWFTRPYYRMNPINQLEFRLKLIRELCECNNIPPDMVRFIYSKNPHYNSFSNKNYENMKQLKLDINVSKSTKVIDGEYIVFHTKCRHNSNEHYELLKHKITTFCINYKSSYKIVILGERNFPRTEEVDAHGITQIYNELTHLTKNNEVIDMSIDCIYSNLNYETYKKDIEIIKHATHNISFGVGGAFCNSICFGKSTIVYCRDELICFNIETLNNNNVHHFNAAENCFDYIVKLHPSR
jgi:hypothetical protein